MMSKRTPNQWIKDWWEAFNAGLDVLWPAIVITGIVILILLLMLQK